MSRGRRGCNISEWPFSHRQATEPFRGAGETLAASRWQSPRPNRSSSLPILELPNVIFMVIHQGLGKLVPKHSETMMGALSIAPRASPPTRLRPPGRVRCLPRKYGVRDASLHRVECVGNLAASVAQSQHPKQDNPPLSRHPVLARARFTMPMPRCPLQLQRPLNQL